MNSEEKYMRRIRSFVRREGRLTPGQEKAITQFWPQYGLENQHKLFDFKQAFKRETPLVLEIGFGMGHSLLAMAKANPEKNFIGIEVHRPGVGTLLAAMAAEDVQNIRIFNTDAVEVLEECIADNSLSEILIFFPDPWPKKRHHKRRLIQPAFVELLYQKLVPQGHLHLATDWQDYAEHMMEVVSEHDGFVNVAGIGNYIERPNSRPLTKFEKRGQKLGHGVWDLLFTKIDSSRE